MADGFIIGSSEDTTAPPVTYWNGTGFTPEIDEAAFYDSITESRTIAGGLQVTYSGEHVESYAASKVITHTPLVGQAGI